MSDGIYIGMSAAVARMRQIDAIADNLANVETPGFKAAKPAFASFLPPEGTGDKVYADLVGTALDRSPGTVRTTGNPLDVLPEGDLMLLVRRPDGGTALTRDGRLRLDGDGRLVTATGHAVLDRNGEPLVLPPETKPTIEVDGKVRADDLEIGHLALVRVEGNVERLGGALLAPETGARVEQVPGGRVRIGEIELSNTTALDATVELIGAHRAFDQSMQAIQTYRKLDERMAELGRVR